MQTGEIYVKSPNLNLIGFTATKNFLNAIPSKLELQYLFQELKARWHFKFTRLNNSRTKVQIVNIKEDRKIVVIKVNRRAFPCPQIAV